MNAQIRHRIEQIRRGEVPRGYKQIGSAIIPIDWYMSSFSDLAIIRSGLVDPKVIPYLRMQHVGPDNIDKNGRIIATKSANDLGLISGKFCFDASSIVYSKIRPNLNKVCMPDFEGICSADCYSIKANDKIDKIYLYNLMRSFPFYKRAVACSMRTGMPKINQDDLNQITLVVPKSFSEQQKIATILITQDKVINLKEKRLAEKQRQKTYLMQQLLTGKKRLPGFDKKWSVLKLSTLAKKEVTKNSGFIYSHVLSNSAQNGIVPQEEQFEKEIANTERIDTYFIVKPGDFVYNPRISVTAPCGPINMNETEMTGIMSPLYLVFSIYQHTVNKIYLKEYFKSTGWFQYMKGVANYGARHDRMSIADDDFFAMPIPVPSVAEQAAIVDILTTADHEIELLQDDLNAERQKKKALMQLLLTGIVRV